MRRVLALPAAVTVAVLAACTPGPSPVDLAGVVSADDAPVGTTWVESGAELTAGDDLHAIEHEWDDSAGEPAACFPMYLVPYGLATTDEGSSDRTVELGYFAVAGDPAGGAGGSILANAREFPDEQAAIAYLDDVEAAADACPGYVIGGHRVAPDGFRVDSLADGAGLIVDGGSGSDRVTSRTAIVRDGRAIVVIDAFLETTEVEADVVDDLARTILDRLATD